MLSQTNIDKLVLSGLYKHEPDKRYRSSIHWDNLYWCFNWTFIVSYNKNTNKYYMVDTYYNDAYIELTDENFNEFEFLFDFNQVEKHSGHNIDEYDEDDWWHVAVDSGGMYCGGKYFLRKGAKKSKDRVLERIQDEIDSLERELANKKKAFSDVKNDKVDLRCV